MKKRQPVLTLLLTLLFVFSAVAGGAASDSLQFRAGRLEYESDLIKLREGVTIFRDDITIKAQWGDIYRREDEARLEDDVEMTFDGGVITARKMTARLDENIYIFREDVVFNREQAGREIVLRAPYLELNDDEDSFAAREGVEIDYGERRLMAENADYDEETDQLVLTEQVQIEDEDDGWIRGDRAVFYLEEEDDKFEVDGNVEMEIEI